MDPDNIQDDFASALNDLQQEGEQGGQNEQVEDIKADIADPVEGEQSTQVRQRDASGRFVPKQGEPGAEPLPQDQKQGTKDPLNQEQQGGVPPAPKPAAIKAPVSWTPAVREKWDKLDPEVQQEVMRREREVDIALNRTAQARQFVDQFSELVRPYEMFFRQENAHPLQAIGSLLNTAALLRTAPPQQKAQLVASMIQQFGVDIGQLDQYLTAAMQGGFNPQQHTQNYEVQRLVQEQLAPFQQFLDQQRQQQQLAYQRTEQAAAQTLEQFLQDPANEFAEQVRDDMADLLEIAARRGQVLSLQDAYKRATLAHPQISEVMQQRQARQGAAQQSQAALRARQASASLPGSGAPSQGDDDQAAFASDDLRSAVSASIRTLSGSR